jgi:site-specific recombinase XerC
LILSCNRTSSTCAPILSIQKLSGHKNIDTTLIYTRLYDSTVAAD